MESERLAAEGLKSDQPIPGVCISYIIILSYILSYILVYFFLLSYYLVVFR
jgi:hypothetical protein